MKMHNELGTPTGIYQGISQRFGHAEGVGCLDGMYIIFFSVTYKIT